jgi:hypothetical protein
MRHYEDDMGNLKFLEKDYAWVTDQLKQLAAEMCNKRIVSMLEGGYVMTSLAQRWCPCVRWPISKALILQEKAGWVKSRLFFHVSNV